MPWWANMFLANGTEQGVARFARAFAIEGADKDHVHHAHTAAVVASLIVGLSGIGLCAGAYLTERGARMRLAARNAIGPVYKWAYDKFYVDELYGATIIALYYALCRLSAWFDRWIPAELRATPSAPRTRVESAAPPRPASRGPAWNRCAGSPAPE